MSAKKRNVIPLEQPATWNGIELTPAVLEKLAQVYRIILNEVHLEQEVNNVNDDSSDLLEGQYRRTG